MKLAFGPGVQCPAQELPFFWSVPYLQPLILAHLRADDNIRIPSSRDPK